MLAGSDGAITGVANVYPQTLKAIHRCWQEGDLTRARQHQDSIAPFRACLARANPNTVVKAATNLRGFAVGPCRAPFSALSVTTQEALTTALQEGEQSGLA